MPISKILWKLWVNNQYGENMKYSDALDIIIKKQSLGIKPGLDRMKRLLEIMGNPQDDIRILHIAGTNGKGTVAYTIAKTLMHNGFKTGLFTSPWVINYREQIQINGDFIPEDTLASYVEQYQAYDATEFELLTAIMYKYFSDEKVDYAVVECGMGGLEDATNVEKDNLAVITSISLDHVELLGDTIEKIARQKAGIIRENSVCVLYPNPTVENIFEDICKQKNTRLIKVPDEGDYISNNLETAVKVIFEMGLNLPVIIEYPPARFECIHGVFIDGGHNPSAARALINTPPYINKEVAVIGMMADKDIDGYISIIAPKCKKIIATTPDNPRAMPARELKTVADKYCPDVTVIENPAVAVKQPGVSLVCGSFFLARDVREILLNRI